MQQEGGAAAGAAPCRAGGIQRGVDQRGRWWKLALGRPSVSTATCGRDKSVSEEASGVFGLRCVDRG